MKYSAQEKHRELLREIEMRKSVYPRRVMTGSMSKRQADRQIAILQEIAEDYRAKVDKERLL
jgi:hypothetical protein